jgi:hypothetical protein
VTKIFFGPRLIERQYGSPVNAMDDGNTHAEIAVLEERIAALTESLERCRKLALLSKFVIAAGLIWIVLMALQLLPFVRFNIAGTIAAITGGIAVFGSNASTTKQTEARLREAEALRAELIGSMPLRLVKDIPQSE